jgi:signal transduction histidine kinase
MTAVLVVVLALSLFLTYGTLTRSAESAARERLSRAARQVAGTVQVGALGRFERLRAIARDSLIVRALRGEIGDTARIARLLDQVRLPGDSVTPLPVELWDATGRRIAYAGPDVPGVRPRFGDGGAFTPLYAADSGVYFWNAAPVVDAGRQLGYVAQRRRVGGPRQANETLQDLIGEHVIAYMRNASGDFWTSSPGVRAATPTRRVTRTGTFNVRPNIGDHIVGEAPVAGTPWVVVLETPVRSVHAQTRRAVLTLALLSLVLVAGGAALSWAISRRVTRPLGLLTEAAEAIARGDQPRKVEDASRDEIGRLTASFNQMASEVTAARRELERRIGEAEQAQAEAERASRAKSDFLAVMSHELRTPLNAIGGYAQLLELGVHGPINEAQRDALVRLGRSQSNLLRLINDVLNFAKIDAGQLQYSVADVVVDETITNLEPLIAPQVSAKGVTFAWRSCADSHVTVRADADKLQQVLLNVVTNAIKFTPAGGKITINCNATDERVYVRVGDTGVGIPADRLSQIFEPFVQGHRALNRPHEGVGLGLAISRDLMRGMGGDLTVESAVGQGSVFTIELARRANNALRPAAYRLEASRGS